MVILGDADLETLVEQACNATGADGAAIAIRDIDGIFCRATTGHAPSVGSRLDAESGLTRTCLESGEPVLCSDAENDVRVRRSVAVSWGLRSVLAVPIQADLALGVIEVFSSRLSAFDMTHVRELQRIAKLVARPPMHVVADSTPVEKKPLGGKLDLILWIAGVIGVCSLPLTFVVNAYYKSETVPVPRAIVASVPTSIIYAHGTQTVETTTRLTDDRPSIPLKALPEAIVIPPESKPPVVQQLEPPIIEPTVLGDSVEMAALLTTPSRSIKPVAHPLPDFVLARALDGRSGWVTAVAFSMDGQRLASASWDGIVTFWDVIAGQEVAAIVGTKKVQALAFSRDGRWLATEDSSDVLTLWETTTRQKVRTFHGRQSALGTWVYSIAFSPDGRLLASCLDEKTVRLWDVATGGMVRDLPAHRRSVVYIAFSPDGHWLATGEDDKTIEIWDVITGQEVRTLSGHKKNIYAAVFSPDGHWLASGGADKTVKLWDLVTGREVYTLTGHGNVVTSLAFSPDSRWLASGSWDKTIRIWDVDTGRLLQRLVGHDHPVYTVAFDSRGHWLASGSEDGTIKLWQLNSTS